MARGIPLVIIESIERIHLGAGANDCLGFQGAEALRHRWNWNKWGRNKLPYNDTTNFFILHPLVFIPLRLHFESRK